MRRIRRSNILIAGLMLLGLWGCKDIAVPKPRGYFRIDLPEKEYLSSDSAHLKEKIPFVFEYPGYGVLTAGNEQANETGWYNIGYPAFKARIYLTYKNVNNDLADLIEQTYTMNVKNHIAKADAINEQTISNIKNKVFGVLYELKGNTASAVQFYVTDSIKNYLRGSLYFAAEPDADSLAPVIDFIREDIIHLIETLEWREN